jgi:CBS domain-containing protein
VALPETSLEDATDLMKHRGVPVIIVYDGRRLDGVLSGYEMGLHGLHEMSENTIVKNVMRTNVTSCFGDDCLADALSRM